MSVTDLLQDAGLVLLATASIVQSRTIRTMLRWHEESLEREVERELRSWLEAHGGEQ
jgi:hypothetical protein